jgi:hypothetical protein
LRTRQPRVRVAATGPYEEEHMADASTGNESPLLVVSAEGGGTFAIPMDVVEQYKVPEEHVEEVAGGSDDDVGGFATWGVWTPPKIVAPTSTWLPGQQPIGTGGATSGLPPR